MEETTQKSCQPPPTKASRLFRVNLSLIMYKVFNFTFWGSLGCYLPYLSLYFKQLGFSPSAIGLVSALRPVFGFALLPFIAAAADKFRCRKLVLIATMVLGALVLLALALLPLASEVPCDVMEEQIWEFLHLNISLPCLQRQADLSEISSSKFSSAADSAGVLGYELAASSVDSPEAVIIRDSRDELNLIRSKHPHSRSTRTSDNLTVCSHFPKQVQEVLFADQRWLYEQEEIGRLILIVFAVSSFIEVIVFSSTCQADIATLNALRQEHGHVDQYGWHRGFGTLGWGTCSFVVGLILNATRTVVVSCGIEHVITGYWAAILSSIGVSGIAFICVLYFKFTYKDKDDVEDSSWIHIKRVIFSWHYGSVIVLLTFVGVCNGAIWGFLFWYYENLGATQALLGVVTAIQCLSEFTFGYVSGWAIPKFGHIPLLSLGLFFYVLRFIYYSLVIVPWKVIFIELFHGLGFIMTWTTAVSYLNESVPLHCGGTMQGILIATQHGLGAGIGFFITGILITKCGAPRTFFLYAISCIAGFILFVIIQRLSKVPQLPWKSEEASSSSTQEGGEPEEDAGSTKKLLSSPTEETDKYSLKLPPFKFQTKAVKQQDLW